MQNSRVQTFSVATMNVIKYLMLLSACMISLGSFAVAPTDLNEEQGARYQHIIEELRCLVCQNQTIADSNAELAVDLRNRVHEQILAGKSDAEILDYMTDRYGDFVLYRPPMKAKTIALWVGPFVILFVALSGLWLFSRRSPKQLERSDDEQAADSNDSNIQSILDKLES